MQTENKGPASKKKRLLLGGCLVAIVLAVICAVALAVAVRKAVRDVKEVTDTEPATLPVTEVTPREARRIGQRVRRFEQALRRGQSERLTLTDKELNALVAADTRLEELRGRVHFRIEDGALQADLAIPMDTVPALKGRYLNATVTLDVSTEQGRLVVRPEKMTVGGDPLPAALARRFENVNLADRLRQDETAAELLRRIRAVRVTVNRLVVTGGDEADTDRNP